jgi:Rrf2 family nitric oxide-sensitive transcriptional repressor
MRLTFYSDYSLRLLMYAAVHEGKLVTVRDAAEIYGISRAHLMKVAYELGRHGILETVRGRGGGIRLSRPARDINLGQVLRLTEEDFNMVECFDARTNHCAIARACRLKNMLHQAMNAFLEVLDGYSLADLTRGNPALARALAPA